jgi:hypothetical protein
MPDPQDHASPFSEMAASIEHNKGQGFGGAFIVVPPAEGGRVLSVLILDGAQNAAQFWAMLKTRCELELAELEDKARASSSGFGRR